MYSDARADTRPQARNLPAVAMIRITMRVPLGVDGPQPAVFREVGLAIEMALSVTIFRWAGGNVSLNWQMGMTVWAVIRLKWMSGSVMVLSFIWASASAGWRLAYSPEQADEEKNQERG